ncbi:hypothetical protein BDN72DRAFT_133965 [Pluteus cervinus]|uniref:Uncharacterized protein n=1 Tax=Pluteus cervinus TaxID=181527 RepID=A0ACD3AN52_9AGAR|nr:hypothetical protein BDN72DRAFT_133965 [Pluteus cervinus]
MQNSSTNSQAPLNAPLADARRKIDEEIQRLKVQILALSTARNALALVSRLPTELHIVIFSMAVEKSSSKSFTAFSLSAVSRQWRDLALSLPQLWASIDIPSVEWIQESIARSGDFPLSFSLTGLRDGVAEPLSTLFNCTHIPRIHNLALSGHLMNTYLQIPYHSPFLSVKTLFLRSFDVEGPLFFPKGSSLEEVTLRDCIMRWNQLPSFPHLQVLSIITPRTLITPKKLISVLKSTPSLQVLETQSAMVSDNSDVIHHIKLPGFSSLAFSKEALTCATKVLRSLNIDKIPDISVSSNFDFPNEFYSLLRTWRFMRAMCPSSFQTAVALHILAREEKLSIKFTEIETYTYPPRRISSEFAFETERMTAQVAEFSLQYFSLTDLEELELSGYQYGPDPTSAWWQMLGSLENLRTLIVRNQYAPEFVNYLIQESEPHQPQDDILHTPSPLTPVTRPRSPFPGYISFKALKTLIYEESRGSREAIHVHMNQLVLMLNMRIPSNLFLNNLVVIVKNPLNQTIVRELTDMVGDFQQMVRKKASEKAELVYPESSSPTSDN